MLLLLLLTLHGCGLRWHRALLLLTLLLLLLPWPCWRCGLRWRRALLLLLLLPWPCWGWCSRVLLAWPV